MILAEAGLPPGVSLSHSVLILIVIGTVTVALRAFPFLFIKRLQSSDLVAVLGRTMPVGVMVVLVAYTMVESSHGTGGWWPALIALAGTIALHLWRKSVTLSILCGTALYVVLVNVVW